MLYNIKWGIITMKKIYYRYGTMFSGKSLNLISAYHTYKHNKKNVLVIKPSIDTRDANVIKSRMSSLTVDCVTFSKEDKLQDVITEEIRNTEIMPDILLIDEVQFCTPEQIDELHTISEMFPIMCYGLKTSYTGAIFPSIVKLMAIAEDSSEIKTTCSMCNKKATHNLLIRDGRPIYEGAYINIEDNSSNDKYYAVCREHFFNPVF